MLGFCLPRRGTDWPIAAAVHSCIGFNRCADFPRVHVRVTVLCAVLSRLPESVNVVALVSLLAGAMSDVLKAFLLRLRG